MCCLQGFLFASEQAFVWIGWVFSILICTVKEIWGCLIWFLEFLVVFFCCSFCRSIFDFWQVFIDGAAFTKIRGFTLTFPKYLDLLHQLTISIFIQYFYFSFLRMPSDLLWRHFWGRIFSLWLCKYLLSHFSCVLSIDPAWSTYHYR